MQTNIFIAAGILGALLVAGLIYLAVRPPEILLPPSAAQKEAAGVADEGPTIVWSESKQNISVGFAAAAKKTRQRVSIGP